MNLNIGCERQVWARRIAVYIRTRPGAEALGSSHSVMLPATFRQLTPTDAGIAVEPALSLGEEDAQSFMDELWRCGLRPTEGTGSAGSLAATERHLADMRAIVFKSAPKA